MIKISQSLIYKDVHLCQHKDEVIERFITSLPQRHNLPDEGRKVLSGVIIDLDSAGKAKKIQRILINDDHPFE